MSLVRKLWRTVAPNPFDRLLQKNKGSKILIVWNRGLGDIALGLYAMIHRIREKISDADITFLIRKDLEEGFGLLENVSIIVDPAMQRGKPYALPKDLPPFDQVIENADPTYWVAWQRGFLTPKLKWNEQWDALHKKFDLPENCLGAHVNCETNYYHARNWPVEKWQQLFDRWQGPIVLFGLKKEPLFTHNNLYDLRGELSLYELLSVIKNRCSHLVAPDSGILSMAYFLDTPFPLRLVSLWADPNHGILKQAVASPNPLLVHTPVISPNRKCASLIAIEEVERCLRN